MASIWCRKTLELDIILSADIICSEKRPVKSLGGCRNTVSFKDIFVPNGGYCVLLSFKCFCNKYINVVLKLGN